jgi:hypothetical protein
MTTIKEHAVNVFDLLNNNEQLWSVVSSVVEDYCAKQGIDSNELFVGIVVDKRTD